MVQSIKLRKGIFLLLEISLTIAAGYHILGLFYKVNDSTVLRHAVFASLDLFCVYGFVKIQKNVYFILFLSVFTLQQYYSHGQQLIQLWINQHEIHWISVLVLLLMPLGLICLIADAWQSTTDGVFTNPNAQ